jgi:hypothetical protein
MSARNISARRCIKVFSLSVAALPNCVRHTNESYVRRICVYGINQAHQLFCRGSDKCVAHEIAAREKKMTAPRIEAQAETGGPRGA